MDRLNFYTAKSDDPVLATEMNSVFDGVENAIAQALQDATATGWYSGAVAAETGPVSEAIDVTAGVGYDPDNAFRIAIDAQTPIDLSGTDVLNVGDSKWISVVARFVRATSDPRTDADEQTVNFISNESFTVALIIGTDAVTPVRPTLLTGDLLICDVLRIFGQSTFADSDIDLTRRPVFTVAGNPNPLEIVFLGVGASVLATATPVVPVPAKTFTPDDYPNRTFKIRATGSVSVGALTGTVTVRNITAGPPEIVATIPFTGSAGVFQVAEAALTVGTASGEVPPTQTLYEVEISVTGALGTDVFTCGNVVLIAE